MVDPRIKFHQFTVIKTHFYPNFLPLLDIVLGNGLDLFNFHPSSSKSLLALSRSCFSYPLTDELVNCLKIGGIKLFAGVESPFENLLSTSATFRA